MVDCSYCTGKFESEEAYLEHLASEHEDELGPIDRRRVTDTGKSESSLPLSAGPLALVAVIGLSVVIVAYVTFSAGGGPGGGNDGPYELGSVHEHGIMNMTVTGEQVDFSKRRYQHQARPFHFEGGNGAMWHTHAKGVTFAYAMETLNITVTQSSVTFNGTTYRDDDSEWNVIVEVNGESVNPEKYVLQGASERNAQQGDNIRIVVRRA